jgi:stage II sporulation protein D
VRRALAALFVAAAAGCTGAPPPVTQPARPTPPAQPAPSPTAVPAPTRVPTVPPPAAMPAGDVDPPLVRVLLERSASAVELPQPGRAYRVTTGRGAGWLWGPIVLRAGAAGPRWWQVGAWSDPSAAAAAASRLEAGLGPSVRLDRERTPAGLTRVRVQWPSGEPGDPSAALAALGFASAFPIAGAGELRIEGADGSAVTSAEEVLLEPDGDWPVAVGARRYRGRLRVRPVGSEVLVINELNMESYLQGVVPVEMGPAQFPELAALKAQAVAARTYAVAHLGDHADEGWDLCDTPACQAYWGAGAEHPLSNRAVRETAGLIAVYAGAPIDAMYSSTCGGHTEDAALLFPDRAQPYLSGVPCAWERPIDLLGEASDGDWVSSTGFAATVAAHVLGVEERAAPAVVLERVRSRVGRAPAPLAAPSDPDAFAAALLEGVGIDPPPGIAPGAPGLQRLLFLADLYKVPLDPPIHGMSGQWPAAAALAALELAGEVTRDTGEAVPRPNGAGIFPRRAEHGEDLPTPLPLWERWAGGWRRRTALEVLPGTVLERLRVGDRVVALVVQRSGGDGEADRRSAWREWVRERSWPELERMLALPGLERLTVTARSPSGRVIGLSAVARDGSTRQWSGFAVRQALELPETLFSLHLRTTADGERVVRFLGRGWGHGVGLCQHGAYGLARAGMGFERILGHYYTGVEVVRWQQPPVAGD